METNHKFESLIRNLPVAEQEELKAYLEHKLIEEAKNKKIFLDSVKLYEVKMVKTAYVYAVSEEQAKDWDEDGDGDRYLIDSFEAEISCKEIKSIHDCSDNYVPAQAWNRSGLPLKDVPFIEEFLKLS